MTSAEEVAILLKEIQKEFTKSVSSLVLKVIDNVDFEKIPDNIDNIQNLQNILMQDMQNLKKNLDTQVSTIEKTELIINILKYKLYECQYNFRTETEKLKKKNEDLIKISQAGKNEPTIALKIIAINNEISNLEETHQKNLDCIKEQKVQALRAYEKSVEVMDSNFKKLSNGFNSLLILMEAEKSSLSPSQAKQVNLKFAQEISEFKADIERFTELQTSGWKVIYQEEKIAEILNQRGLKVLHSGQLITDDGQTISFKEAKRSTLLDDMAPSFIRELRANLAEYNNEDSNSTLSTGSMSNDRLSTEDVTYLRNCLGKPLVLALTEISTLQPKDPIQYLSHWLFKYRYNPQIENVHSNEYDILIEKRNSAAKEKLHKNNKEDARAALLEIIFKAENIVSMNELNSPS